MPVEFDVLVAGEGFGDKVGAGRFPPGGFGFGGLVERFVAFFDESHVVGAVESEGDGDGCSSDFVVVEINQGGLGRGGDREGALDAAGECGEGENGEKGEWFIHGFRL